MITQTIDHRKKKKIYSSAIFPVIIVAILLLVLVMLPNNQTGKVVSNLGLSNNNYTGNQGLNGLLTLNISQADRLPLNSSVTFRISSQGPLDYVCANGESFEWYNISGLIATEVDSPWDYYCGDNQPDPRYYSDARNCEDYNKTCCSYGVSGKVYVNLACGTYTDMNSYGLCGDQCISVVPTYNLSQIIAASNTPNRQNITNGIYKYVNGSQVYQFPGNPTGSGLGYCFDTSGGIGIDNPPETIPQNTGACVDSDAADIYLKGTCKDWRNNFTTGYDDSCNDETWLNEKKCLDFSVSSSVNCSSLCGSASCRYIGNSLFEGWYADCQSPNQQDVPGYSETLIMKGKCSVLNSSYKPVCVQQEILPGRFLFYWKSISYYCNSNSTGSSTLCTFGCSYGKCTQNSCAGWNNAYYISLENLSSIYSWQPLKAPANSGNYSLDIYFQFGSTIFSHIASSFIVRESDHHMKCNTDHQCVRVTGNGDDECDSDADCGSCTPSWNCTDWIPSQCASGLQYRSCTDVANCVSPSTKTETRNCSYSCTPYWNCAWQDCSEGMQQQKLCTDSMSCNPNNSTYVQEYRDCCVEDWTCSSWSKECDNGFQTRYCTDVKDCGTSFQIPVETQKCEKTSSSLTWILIVIVAVVIVFLLFLRTKVFRIHFKRFGYSPGHLDTIRREVNPRENNMSEITSYIRKSISVGYSKKEIEESLLRRGWPRNMVDQAFNDILS